MGGSGRPLGPSRSETEGQDGSKLGPKREVLGVQKRSENGCIIGSLSGATFSLILGRFWDAQGNQLGIKMKFNIDRTSQSEFIKKPCFFEGKTMIWMVQGLEVGGNNQ